VDWSGFFWRSPAALADEANFGPRLIQEEVRIPAGSYSLAPTILRPQAAGRYGAVVLNHGTPDSASDGARESTAMRP
jgi:hypothetical protein